MMSSAASRTRLLSGVGVAARIRTEIEDRRSGADANRARLGNVRPAVRIAHERSALTFGLPWPARRPRTGTGGSARTCLRPTAREQTEDHVDDDRQDDRANEPGEKRHSSPPRPRPAWPPVAGGVPAG